MYEIVVSGMSCNHCVSRVTRAIKQTDPLAQVSIELDSGKVNVSSQLARSEFETALDEAGYPPVG